MKTSTFFRLFPVCAIALLAGFSADSSAESVSVGTGLSNGNANQLVANIVYSKADKRRFAKGITTSFHTGDNRVGQTVLQAPIPTVTSTSWCEGNSDPDAPPNPPPTGTYYVTAAFDEPMYNRDTVFNGFFVWDDANKTVTSMRGVMNQVMV